VSVRTPEKLKRLFEGIMSVMNLKRKIVEFLERRVTHYKKVKVLRNTILMKQHSAWISIREDRDSY